MSDFKINIIPLEGCTSEYPDDIADDKYFLKIKNLFRHKRKCNKLLNFECDYICILKWHLRKHINT